MRTGDRRTTPRSSTMRSSPAACRQSRRRSEEQLHRSRDGPAGARQRGRVVPGPVRMGAAVARQPQHPRQSPPRGHEGHRQHEDQVSRALPAVRAIGAGRARGALLRSGRTGSATCRRDSCCSSRRCATRPSADSRGDARGWLRPAAGRRPAQQSALPSVDRIGSAPPRACRCCSTRASTSVASRSSTRPQEALSTFQRSGMDALVLGETIVFKHKEEPA